MSNRITGLNGHAAMNGRGAEAPLAPSADGSPTLSNDPANGRFLPGNKAGRGNPHYRRLAANRTAFLEAVGPEQVKALAIRLCEQALAGDMDAARLVLAYGIGRPLPPVDPDAADVDEWRLREAWPHFADMLTEVGKHVRPHGEALASIKRMEEESKPVPLFVGASTNG